MIIIVVINFNIQHEKQNNTYFYDWLSLEGVTKQQ